MNWVRYEIANWDESDWKWELRGIVKEKNNTVARPHIKTTSPNHPHYKYFSVYYDIEQDIVNNQMFLIKF